MKLNKSFEQATYVLTMLALQIGHQPVKSHVLSRCLQVSDSSLKKILMKLAKAGVVQSNASKSGGYQLARPITDIHLKDIFFALEIQAEVLDFRHMAHQVYAIEDHVRRVERLIEATLERGLEKFYNQLEDVTLADLLSPEAYNQGLIDWNQQVEAQVLNGGSG